MASAALLPIFMTGASAVMQFMGARQQARAVGRAESFNQQVAEQNAAAARQQAEQEAAQLDRENRLRLGSVRAGAGAAGIAPEGSVLDLVGDLTTQGELARQDALHRGELRARGFAIDAQLSAMAGRSAQRAGRMAAGTALLSGGASVYDQGFRLGLFGGGG